MMHTMAVTQADYRVLTPDHASPEQIRGDPITTASDIYVLGVAVVRAAVRLQAVHAARQPSRRSRARDLRRARRRRRAWSSQRARGSQPASRGSAARRPARLRRELARRSRQHRADGDAQGSGAALFLGRAVRGRRRSATCDGMPVLARADAWSYRAGKFLKRHSARRRARRRLPRGARRLLDHDVRAVAAHRARARRGQAERARAQTAQRARRGRRGFPDRFVPARRSVARARQGDHRARDPRPAARRASRKELRAQPDLQATLLDTIGSVYLSLDLPGDAQPLIEQGLAVRRKLFGERAPGRGAAACTASIASTRRRAT